MIKYTLILLPLLCLCSSTVSIAQVIQPQCPSQATSCKALHLAANATTVIKSGAGILHTVTINTIGTTDTVTLYDNTAGSGTVIAVISSTTPVTLLYDSAFYTGLTAVIAGTTAPDITINYN